MKLDATRVQLESEIVRTSDNIRRRYAENLRWRLYPKEWIYKNISMRGKDVLDFGCGTGETTTQVALLGARNIYAIDVSTELLDATQRRAELDDVAGCVKTLCGMIQHVEPRPVDVIIAFAVLHHCLPVSNIMPWLLRWLKPGGVFVAVEPVGYLAPVDWLRNHSGIPFEALDEGERKLNGRDVEYIVDKFSESHVVHFHLLGRLSRVWPKRDLLWRRIDRLMLRAPLTWKLAGTVLILGRV